MQRMGAHLFKCAPIRHLESRLLRLVELLCNGPNEFLRADLLRIGKARDGSEVACHDARLNRADGSLLKLVGKGRKLGQVVQLPALGKGACPGEDGCH